MLKLLLCSGLIGYFLGSVNASVIVSKIAGNDVRKHGSGNAGATNTLRVLGKRAAVFVVILDVLKVVLSVVVSRILADVFGADAANKAYGAYIAAIFTVIGHNFPIFFGFRGGKGIVTSVAVMFLFDWRVALCALSVGVLMIVLTRYVSLGSITGSVLYPMFTFAFYYDEPQLYLKMQILLALFLGVLAIVRHKNNIVKLLAGNESKIGDKAKS